MDYIKLGEMKKKLASYLAEAVGYLCYYLKPLRRERMRVVLFGQGRSGSTLLENLICSTGYFYESGELLNSNKRGEVKFPYHYITGVSKKKNDSNFIFHVKIYQLTRDRRRAVDAQKFLFDLHADGWKIIYLRRRNKLKHVLSNLVLRHRGEPFKVNDTREEIRLTVNCEEFAALVNERLRLEREELSALEGLNYHEVVYEDDLEKQEMQQLTINRLLSYLSLAEQDVHSRFRKVNDKSLRDLIVNYDEFMDCINQNGWQNYLEE